MDKRLERILPRVQKPARYVGGEYNAVMKDLSQVDTRVAFCFPDTYESGMSNLGMRILYGIMNSVPAKPAKEWKPIELKYDGAPLMPSQQILLAGPKDISNPAPAAKEVQFEAKRTDAPLPPSQLILLGLK